MIFNLNIAYFIVLQYFKNINRKTILVYLYVFIKGTETIQGIKYRDFDLVII